MGEAPASADAKHSDDLPLSGIRVLDATNRLGAYCGRLLADFGADVVKIESQGGSPLRRVPPLAVGTGESLPFAYFEANKRGVQVDIGAESSRVILRDLAVNADVILLTPSEAEPVVGFAGVGVDWAPPTAAVVVITPFGATGPLRGWRATHLTSCAMAGLLIQQGPADGAPVVIPDEQMYAYVGINAAITAMAALRSRDAGAKKGQIADLSAHDILTSANYLFHNYAGGSFIGRRGAASTVEYGSVWECSDGFVEYLVSTPKQWDAFVELLGRPAELTDPEFATPDGRLRRSRELTEAVGPLVKSMNREHFVGRGQELGVPCALVNTVEDFVRDGQPRSRGYFIPLEVGGVARDAPGAPYRASRRLAELYRRPAPRLGNLLPAEVVEQWRTGPSASRSVAPLAKMRVLSFGTVIAGGLIGSVLADLGADVVKIESPVRPDTIRGLAAPGQRPSLEPSGAVTSSGFASFNRSVRSLAMDMRNPAAVELFLQLLSSADILVENFSPKVMSRWGLDYERLQNQNPRLVHLSVTGFGRTDGPRSHYAAYGATVCSFVGLTRTWGYSSQTHFDYAAHAHAVLAVLGALAARDRTGRGMFIDLAMVEAGSTLMGPMMLDWSVNGRQVVQPGNRIAGSFWSGVSRCSGHDSWIAIETPSEQEWQRLAAVIGHPTAERAGATAGPAFEDKLARWLSAKTAFQAARLLQQAGVAAAPVQNTEDLYRDPQLRARGSIVEIPHPDLGPLEFIAPVHRLQSGPRAVHSVAPRLGADGEDVLADWLGLPEHDRKALLASGAYWTAGTGVRSATELFVQAVA